MKQNSAFVLLLIIAGIMFANSSFGAPALILEKSLIDSLPAFGLWNHQFVDVNLDGEKDLVVWDDSIVAVYSVANNTLLQTFALGRGFDGHLVCADVNRDHIPDICVALKISGGPSNYTVVIRAFDGASNFVQWADDTIETDIPGSGSQGVVGAFAAFDIDQDGYSEFLFSVDSAIERSWPYIDGDADWKEAGHTYCYHGFPDSLAWRGNFYLTGVDSIYRSPVDALIVGRWYDYFECKDAPGVPDFDRSWTLSYIDVVTASGRLSTIVSNQKGGDCNVSHLRNNNHNQVLAYGDMIGNNGTIELLVDYQTQLQGYPLCSWYRDSLVMYAIDDPMKRLWAFDRSAYPGYGLFFHHPDYPGFLAIKGTYLMMLDGNGKPYDSTGPLPAGKLRWEYVSTDGIPRLVAVSGHQLSMYVLSSITDATEPESENLPTAFDLRQVYPNPFNPTTTISFQLPTRQRATITVYDVTGRVVRVLADRIFTPGIHQVVWDGTRGDGMSASSGVYFFRLTTEGLDKSVKGLLIK